MAAVIAPRLEWHLPEPIVEPPRFAGFAAPVATLLARRGFRTDDEVARFLEAGVGTMHPIALMADAEAALDRIDHAIAGGEQIAICSPPAIAWSMRSSAASASAINAIGCIVPTPASRKRAK